MKVLQEVLADLKRKRKKNLDQVNRGNTDLEPSRRIVLANLTLVDVAVNVGVAFYWSPTLLVLVTYFVFFAS